MRGDEGVEREERRSRVKKGTKEIDKGVVKSRENRLGDDSDFFICRGSGCRGEIVKVDR